MTVTHYIPAFQQSILYTSSLSSSHLSQVGVAFACAKGPPAAPTWCVAACAQREPSGLHCALEKGLCATCTDRLTRPLPASDLALLTVGPVCAGRKKCPNRLVQSSTGPYSSWPPFAYLKNSQKCLLWRCEREKKGKLRDSFADVTPRTWSEASSRRIKQLYRSIVG